MDQFLKLIQTFLLLLLPVSSVNSFIYAVRNAFVFIEVWLHDLKFINIEQVGQG